MLGNAPEKLARANTYGDQQNARSANHFTLLRAAMSSRAKKHPGRARRKTEPNKRAREIRETARNTRRIDVIANVEPRRRFAKLNIHERKRGRESAGVRKLKCACGECGGARGNIRIKGRKECESAEMQESEIWKSESERARLCMCKGERG